jgi:hypothetical protein
MNLTHSFFPSDFARWEFLLICTNDPLCNGCKHLPLKQTRRRPQKDHCHLCQRDICRNCGSLATAIINKQKIRDNFCNHCQERRQEFFLVS